MAHPSAQHAAQELQNDEAPNGNQESGKHLVFALLIAAVIVFGARILTDRLVRPAVVPVAATQMSPAEAANLQSVEEIEQIAAEARAARQAREQAVIAEDRARREQKRADAMRSREEAVAVTQVEEARKDAAWQRYFVPARKCVNATDDATRIDCSNQFIRAKERFEKLYAEGKVR